MTVPVLLEKEHEYLGYCEQKGYIYSVRHNAYTYSVVAIKNNVLTTLIKYTVGGEHTC